MRDIVALHAFLNPFATGLPTASMAPPAAARRVRSPPGRRLLPSLLVLLPLVWLALPIAVHAQAATGEQADVEAAAGHP